MANQQRDRFTLGGRRDVRKPSRFAVGASPPHVFSCKVRGTGATRAGGGSARQREHVAAERAGRTATLTSGAYTRTGGDRRRGCHITSLDGAPTIPVVTAPGRDRGVAPATFAFQSLQVHERHAAAVRRARAATRIQVGHVERLVVPTTAYVVVPVVGVRAPDACAQDNVRRRAKGHSAGIVYGRVFTKGRGGSGEEWGQPITHTERWCRRSSRRAPPAVRPRPDLSNERGSPAWLV